MNQERAEHFLRLGLSTGQVASIVGVTPSRISQIKASMQEAGALEEVACEEEERFEAKILAAKNTLLDTLASRSTEASFMEIARAFDIVCRTETYKRNNIPLQGTTVFNGTVVQIAMPSHFVPDIQITKEKEVIAVGSRLLAPLPARQVTNLFKQMKQESEGETYEPASLSDSTEKSAARAF